MNTEWSIVKLGDFISIKSGLSYKGSKIGFGDAILLGMGCVSYKDTFVYSGARPYDGDDIDEAYCVNEGDIVLATRQQSDNLPILAMPAIIPNEFYGKKVIFGTNLYKVDNHSELSNRFIFWLLKNKHYVAYIAGVKSGTAVQMVTKKNVENYKFLCPPKEQREAIADLMWSYEGLIANNNKRIKILEQMAENLYKEWFVRFRFPGHEDVEFEDGIPKGWERIKIQQVYDTSSGGTPSRSHDEYYTEGNIAWIKTGELLDCVIISTEEKITEEAIKYSPAKIIPVNSVIMAMYGVNIGKLGITAIESTCNQACCVFKEKKYKSSKHYLFQYMKSIRDYLLLIGFGAAQQNLSQDLIKKIRIVAPSNKVVDDFEKLINPIYQEMTLLEKKNKNLINQRDLLLPRLMSGKLEVK